MRGVVDERARYRCSAFALARRTCAPDPTPPDSAQEMTRAAFRRGGPQGKGPCKPQPRRTTRSSWPSSPRRVRAAALRALPCGAEAPRCVRHEPASAREFHDSQAWQRTSRALGSCPARVKQLLVKPAAAKSRQWASRDTLMMWSCTGSCHKTRCWRCARALAHLAHPSTPHGHPRRDECMLSA